MCRKQPRWLTDELRRDLEMQEYIEMAEIVRVLKKAWPGDKARCAKLDAMLEEAKKRLAEN